MNNTKTVIMAAPAKVNLVLEILGTDDSGYHKLSTVFQALDLADELLVTKADDTELNIVDMAQSGFSVDASPDNLVLKAQHALETYCGRALPCHIRLIKAIPAGGGLGGGSADAAAMLQALVTLYDLDIADEDLQEIAASIGADVAFGLTGGTALGLGRGDQLTRLPTTLMPYRVVLVIPSRGLSTPEVYKHWDAMPASKRNVAWGKSQRLVNLVRQPGALVNAILAMLSNDLQPAAFEMFPELTKIRGAMLQAGCITSMLCGSGSTMFGLIEPQMTREQVTQLVNDLSHWGRVIVTGLRTRNEDR